MTVFKRKKKTLLSEAGSAVETVLSVLHAQAKRRYEDGSKYSRREKPSRRRTGEAFLGCTNYSSDGKGCGRTMGWPEYQQKMRYEPGYRS